MAKSKTYELMLKIGGQADSSLKNACMTADKNLASLGKTAKTAGKVAAGAVLAVGTAVGTLGVATIKAAGDYEERLANVSTLLVGTEEAVAARTNQIGAQILEVSNRTGVATDNLTDGMYQVISAFGDSEDAATILETAAKSAAAGNATTTDSINLLSAVTKGYGDTSAAAVQKAADLSFATARLGQTNFPELASSMGNVIPLASTLGVEQEQLFGAMATLTGVTGGTAEVTTQLKSTMQAFLSPSKKMADALNGMGYESGKALLESKGLQGALDALQGAVGGDELAFAGLFSSVEAQTAVLSLAGTQADNFTSKTAEMYEATGAADLAFQRQTGTAKYMGKEIINLGNNFLTELGMKALPYVKEFAEAALPAAQEALGKVGSCLVDKVIPAIITAGEWVAKHKTLVLVIVSTITTLVVAFKTLKTAMTVITTVKSLSTVFGKAAEGGGALKKIMGLMNVKLLVIAAVIAAVVAIVVIMVKHWDKVKAVAIAVCEKIKSVWNAVATWFNTNVITPLVNFFSGLFHAVGGFFKNLWAGIKGVWNAVANWFKANVITPLVNFFTPIIRTVGGIFLGCWILIQAVWKAVSTWFNTNVITPVITVFSTVVGAVSGFFTMLWGGIVAVWNAASSWFNTNVITPVVSVFSTVVEAVGGFFSTLWDNIVAVWTAVGAWFGENVATPIMNAFQAVSDFVKGIVNTMLGFVEGMINRIIRGINFFVGGFSNIAGKAAAFIGVEWGGIPELPQVSIPRLAAGGVATAATLAIVGEGSEPEAILPLSKLAALMEELWGKKPKPDGGGNAPDGRIVFAPVLNFAGPAGKTEVETAMQSSFEEFKRMYRQLKAEERRKSFHPA